MDLPEYLRHKIMRHVLKVDTYLFQAVLFVGHSVWQPIQWYEAATEEEYKEYLNSQSTK